MLSSRPASPILSENFQHEFLDIEEDQCPQEVLTLSEDSNVIAEGVLFDWANVVLRFEAAFQEVYCKSKKAHFDCLPPECKVVDGARFRWCPLLLLDAVLYLLSHNGFHFPTRRAFCQQKVLYECILAELEEHNTALFTDLCNKKYSAVLREAIKAVEYPDCMEEEDAEDSRFDDEEKIRIHENATLEFALRFPEIFPNIDLEQSNPKWASISNIRSIALEDPPSKSKQKFITIVDYLSHHHAFYLPLPRVSIDVIFKAIICKVLAYFGTEINSEDSDSEVSSLVRSRPPPRPATSRINSKSSSYSIAISPMPKESSYESRRNALFFHEPSSSRSLPAAHNAHVSLTLRKPVEVRSKMAVVKSHRESIKPTMSSMSNPRLTKVVSDDVMDGRRAQYWEDIRARTFPRRSLSFPNMTVSRPVKPTIRKVEEMSSRTIPRQSQVRTNLFKAHYTSQLASSPHPQVDFFPRYSSLSSDDLLVYPTVFEDHESNMSFRHLEDDELALDCADFNNGMINSSPLQREFCLQQSIKSEQPSSHSINCDSVSSASSAYHNHTNVLPSGKHGHNCCSRCSCRISLGGMSSAPTSRLPLHGSSNYQREANPSNYQREANPNNHGGYYNFGSSSSGAAAMEVTDQSFQQACEDAADFLEDSNASATH